MKAETQYVQILWFSRKKNRLLYPVENLPKLNDIGKHHKNA